MAGENKEVDILNMSDEDLLNFDPSSLESASSEKPTTEIVEESPEQVEEKEEETQEEEEGKEVTNEVEDKDESEQTDESTETSEEKKTDTDTKVSDPKTETKSDSVFTDKGTGEDQVDYKAVYEKLTAPFKANGRDIQIKSVDDAISLMQMGANYNKKMAALKPNLRLMKMLEANGLLDESKLSFLIDLEKKNPDAINKLVKESGIDPLELDADKASGYKPNSYTVDDKEIELDSVLDELQDTPTYSRTLDIVSNKWDGQSKQVIASQPQLLKVINSHVQSGIYDLITKEIESERMFGRLDGLSDIEAYRQVGDAIQARGGFNHLVQNQGQQTQQKPVVVQPKPKKADEDKLREKKRAASSTKPAVSSQTPNKDFNPLSLSDDEFSKLVKNNFL